MTTYEPGTVAKVSLGGESRYIAELRTDFGRPQWFGAWHGFAVDADTATDVRPSVVIDPEDPEQIERLLCTLLDSFARNVSREVDERDVRAAQAALREFANPTPPKPEVYEHLAVRSIPGDSYTAMCGKAWRPSENVTVVGRCPECVAHAESEWIA